MMPGPSVFSRAAGLQQEKRESFRVFFEAGGFGADPALLWMSAKAASLGCEGGTKARKGWSGVGPPRESKDKVPLCPGYT